MKVFIIMIVYLEYIFYIFKKSLFHSMRQFFLKS
jgi:hypothetical protein